MCSNCDTARQYPAYPMFSPACVFCGARLIQRIGKLKIAYSQCVSRRRAVLKDWVDLGHSESKIRELVKGPVALAPTFPTGPEKATESVARKTVKRL